MAFALATCLSPVVAGARPRATGRPDRAPEREVKAALVYNFTRFVDWPADAVPGQDDPVVIAVLGSDAFVSALELTVRDQLSRGRPIEVRPATDLDDARGAQVLFVAAGGGPQPGPAALDKLHAEHVLTIGETAGFLDRGGIIRLAVEGQRVRIHVDLDAADRAGLRLSAQLLKLAEVRGRPDGRREPQP